jgi:pilus assembly protein CpaB
LVFAFIVSAGASLLLYRLVSSKMSANATQPTTQVMVASRSLPVGTMIADMDVKAGAWSGALPAQAMLKKEDVVGRGVIANIVEGEPIVESRLATKGAGAGLAATIPPGMRAVAIRVNEVVGVAGFVVPGQRVDILVMGQPPGGSQGTGTIIRTILQNIEVLSAGQNIEKDSQGKPVTVQVVNLLVTPEQAETLSLISNDMRIQLVLRNPLDTKEVATKGTAAVNVFAGGLYKPPKPPGQEDERPRRRVVKTTNVVVPPPPPAVKVPVVVEVFHGARKTDVNFKDKPEQENPEAKQ